MPDVLEWNGINLNEIEVSDGDYTAAVRVKKDGVVLWERTLPVVVDTKPPVSEIAADPKVFAASPASTVKEMNIRIYPQADDIRRWILYIQDDRGNTIRRFSGEGIPKSFVWNGKDAMDNFAKDGRYRIVVSLEDFAGNVYEASDTFAIDTRVMSFEADVELSLIHISEPTRPY